MYVVFNENYYKLLLLMVIKAGKNTHTQKKNQIKINIVI